jgi:HD-GYP domain-containing protein (c-di-GMP phosphodiesterase class II)
MAMPERELLADSRRLARDGGAATLLVLLLTVPVVVLLSRRLSASLRRLARQAQAIRGFELDGDAVSRSRIAEVDGLVVTFEGMRGTIRRFLDMSALLAAEENVDRLLEQLLEESVQVSGARGGTLVVPPDRRLVQGEVEAADGDGAADCLALPLLSRRGESLGELVLHFAAPPEPARVAFCRALSGNAAVALETRSLIAAQKALFEAFIQLIADAIDAKSPYTGGHCARVPELAKLLATAACEARSGPYAGFALSEQDWEALHLASWLHDCGKVTTPEYVVDKATKLETLYDRIHEIRMRFELLKAEAETAYWRGLAEGGEAEALRRNLEAQWAELDADLAFVAACNRGGEAMAPADLERLQQIAQRRWRRSLDDRLGISNDELRRCGEEPEEPLPCMEPLLADRPRHRIPRSEQQRLQADNPWGFTMAEPELLADRGELRNLSIPRGTLTEEERYAINQHIIQTIRMLEALPYPQHLKAVPEIAGGHHERMDGRGYPRSLSGEQMSPLARMMAIADVFEALTAVDRPYKSGKPLSASLAIMARMVQEQHLDADLFELFVRSGVYRRYGERFLSADQLDAVDEEALLRR